MANVARKLKHADPSTEVGTVALVEDGAITVRSDGGAWRARRAASCLVAPGEGDEVSVVVTGDGRAFVTAVLVAAADRRVEIAVEGDLTIKAEGSMSLVSKALNLRAVEGSVVLSKLTVLASSVLGHSDAVRVAAKAFDGIFERISQTAKTWTRKVDELDVLRAGHADYRTEKEMCLRSENFLVGAQKLAKLDAEQIHIG